MHPILAFACAALSLTLAGLIEGLLIGAPLASVALWLCLLPALLGLFGGVMLAARLPVVRWMKANPAAGWAGVAWLGLGLAALGAWTRLGADLAMTRLQDLGLVPPILTGWVMAGAALVFLMVSQVFGATCVLAARRRWWAWGMAALGVGALAFTLVGPIQTIAKDIPLGPVGSVAGAIAVAMTLWGLRARLPEKALIIGAVCSVAVGVWGLRWFSIEASERAAVLRYVSVSRVVARGLEALTDGDGDGHSARFGGRDCDDTNPAIGPHAHDIPDNGVDEDCDGADLKIALVSETIEVHHPLPSTLATDGRYNLLFVTVDTVRADRLSIYGHDRPTTPVLEKLGQSGLIFERAYTPNNSTRLALPAMMAGRMVGDLDGDYWGRDLVLRRTNNLIFERLQRAGWRTEAVLPEQLRDSMWFGLGWGFDAYLGVKRATIKGRSAKALTFKALQRVDALIARGEPWALWVHYLEPHEPYLKSPDVDFGDARIDRYDAEIATVDRHLGRLVERLESRGVAGKTLIVYTADHGEEFGDHGRRYHGKQLFDESVRVPWVVHVPGAQSVRVPAPVSLLDIPATLSNLMGVAPAPSFGGVSQVNLLSGGQPDWDRQIFLETAYKPYDVRDHQTGVVRWPYKAMFDPDTGVESLYNLETDPQERDDLRRAAGDGIWALNGAAIPGLLRQWTANRLTQLFARAVGSQPPKGAKSQPIVDGLTLLGTHLDEVRYPGREADRLRLWVRADGAQRPDLKIKVASYDAAGRRVRNTTSDPLVGLYPSSAWAPGSTVEINRQLRYPARVKRPMTVKLSLIVGGKTALGPLVVGTVE